MRNFSITEALSFGWNTAKSNIKFFVGVLLIFFVLNAVLSSFGPHSNHNQSPSLLSLLIGLLSYILNIILTVQLIRIALKFVDGAKPSWSDLYSNIQPMMILKLIAASYLLLIGIFVGLLLLVVPGIYLSLRWSFVQYAIIDKNAGILEAFHLSSEWTKGVKLKLLGLALLGVLITILGALALLVGLFWALPTVIVAGAYVYRKLSSQLPTMAPENAPPAPPVAETPPAPSLTQ